MPDRRQHRGPHPEDARLFSSSFVENLRAAVRDLSWLLSRDYSSVSALKLVGDRYSLEARQRLAVARAACSDAQRQQRLDKLLPPARAAGQELWLDGFNVLTTIEAALAGGVLLRSRDGCLRDMASMHGSFRLVAETERAVTLVGQTLATWRATPCRWILDQPVSNSGRLKTLIGRLATQHGWNWEVELLAKADERLARDAPLVASADSHVIHHCRAWANLAAEVVAAHVPDASTIDLS